MQNGIDKTSDAQLSSLKTSSWVLNKRFEPIEYSKAFKFISKMCSIYCLKEFKVFTLCLFADALLNAWNKLGEIYIGPSANCFISNLKLNYIFEPSSELTWIDWLYVCRTNTALSHQLSLCELIEHRLMQINQ